MVVVGLTGGIGAGKSTFAAFLAERGATVVDVDAIGREIITAAGPGADAVLARFQTIDRRKLAAIVFSDDQARQDLEAISWPLIEVELRLSVAGSTADVAVLDMAVLPQGLGRGIYGPVVTVEAPESLRLERLLARGMSEPDARRRMHAQVPQRAREELASVVVVNDGSLEQLAEQADVLLASLLASPG